MQNVYDVGRVYRFFIESSLKKEKREKGEKERKKKTKRRDPVPRPW